MKNNASSIRSTVIALQCLLLLVLCGIRLASADTASIAQHGQNTFEAPPEAKVTVWEREIVILRAPYEELSPQDRANNNMARILAIPTGEAEYRVEAVDAAEGKYKGAWIKVNGKRVVGILMDDVDTSTNQSFEQYKAKVVANLKAWLEIREEQTRWPTLLKGTALSVLATALYWAIIIGLLHLARYWFRRMSKTPSRHSIMLGDVDLRPYLASVEIGALRLSLWGIGLGLGYLWLTFVFDQFPYSKPLAIRLRGFLAEEFQKLMQGMVQSLPDLFTVALIFLLTRLVVGVVAAFFRSAESGGVQSLWLEPETARATRRIMVVLIWIFALVVAYPYIPGSQTEAFKGVSVFIGLMVSLGSAGMVGQVVGGLVVVYARAFQTGDYVKVGEHEGLVREIGVLSTKIVTPRREEITIPNAVLLGATTINYSRLAKKDGAAVATTVTIGYDAPWRQVHAMLEMAAERTSGVRRDPPPKVLQKSLSDFYPVYTLLVSIDRPETRYMVLSELHGHIQDVFNEYGVQIMSPNFEAQPDQPVLSSKTNWYAPPTRQEAPNSSA